jgi:hypothetical protein
MCLRQTPHNTRPHIEVKIFDTDGECVFLESRLLPGDVPRRYCRVIADQAFEKAKWFSENGTYYLQPWLRERRPACMSA